MDIDEHGFNFNPVYFSYLKTSSLKLIFCGQSIASYNYDRGFNPNVCDVLKPLCCIMNTRQLKFYTPAGNNYSFLKEILYYILKVQE